MTKAAAVLLWLSLVPPWLLLLTLGPPLWQAEQRARRRQLLESCGWGVGVAGVIAGLLLVLPA